MFRKGVSRTVIERLPKYYRHLGELMDEETERISSYGLAIRGIEIQAMDNLEKFIGQQDIHIAALTIPKKGAEVVVERLVSAGIKGIWNFAHIDFNVPEDVIVENVHLSDSLMKLSFRLESQSEFMGNSKAI